MGAHSDSPERKRRRHDSRERHSSRDRGGARERSRERGGSHRSGRGDDGHKQHVQHPDRHADMRDRPAGTSGRSHHDSSRREQEREPLNGGRGGSSRHRDWDHDRDRQPADRSRERSRERHRDREGDRQQRDRDRDRDRERERERDAGRGDWGSSRRGREDEGPGGGREGRPQHHQQRHEQGSAHQQQREHRDGRGGDAAGRQQQHQQQQRRGGGGDEPPGKPKWGKPEEWAADEPPPPGPPKEAPNMGLSGKLAAETNKTADGTSTLKFQAPAEARVCKKPVWKLFVYKGADATGDPIALTQLPFYLFGKDRKVADIPTDHPSCSRQHAVIVFREVEIDAADGIGYARAVKPYLLDLETVNGTTINGAKLDGARYYELLTGDVIRFGFSSRDYVIMNESAVA